MSKVSGCFCRISGSFFLMSPPDRQLSSGLVSPFSSSGNCAGTSKLPWRDSQEMMGKLDGTWKNRLLQKKIDNNS